MEGRAYDIVGSDLRKGERVMVLELTSRERTKEGRACNIAGSDLKGKTL